MKKQKHKNSGNFMSFVAGASLALLVVSNVPATGNYFTDVMGPKFNMTPDNFNAGADFQKVNQVDPSVGQPAMGDMTKMQMGKNGMYNMPDSSTMPDMNGTANMPMGKPMFQMPPADQMNKPNFYQGKNQLQDNQFSPDSTKMQLQDNQFKPMFNQMMQGDKMQMGPSGMGADMSKMKLQDNQFKPMKQGANQLQDNQFSPTGKPPMNDNGVNKPSMSAMPSADNFSDKQFNLGFVKPEKGQKFTLPAELADIQDEITEQDIKDLNIAAAKVLKLNSSKSFMYAASVLAESVSDACDAVGYEMDQDEGGTITDDCTGRQELMKLMTTSNGKKIGTKSIKQMKDALKQMLKSVQKGYAENDAGSNE